MPPNPVEQVPNLVYFQVKQVHPEDKTAVGVHQAPRMRCGIRVNECAFVDFRSGGQAISLYMETGNHREVDLVAMAAHMEPMMQNLHPLWYGKLVGMCLAS